MTTEKRLIDANVLLEHLEQCIKQTKGLFRSVCVAIKCFVEQIPTVDAVEVVHGRWEPRMDAPGFVRCSVCRDCNIYDDLADDKSGTSAPTSAQRWISRF